MVDTRSISAPPLLSSLSLFLFPFQPVFRSLTPLYNVSSHICSLPSLPSTLIPHTLTHSSLHAPSLKLPSPLSHTHFLHTHPHSHPTPPYSTSTPHTPGREPLYPPHVPSPLSRHLLRRSCRDTTEYSPSLLVRTALVHCGACVSVVFCVCCVCAVDCVCGVCAVDCVCGVCVVDCVCGV